MTKLRIGVLYGGQNIEHGGSFKAAAGVLAHLDRERFEPVPVRINEDGTWRVAPPGEMPARRLNAPAGGTRAETLTSVMTALAEVDLVFPVLHGKPDEDHAVRGLLDLVGIPYVGGGPAGMDPAVTTAVLRAEGIDVALRGVPGPVERAVPGREVSVSVLEYPGGRVVASPPVLARRDGRPELDPELAATLAEVAIRVFQVLGFSGLAQLGFEVHGDDEVVVHEIDTRPLLVPGSPAPAAWSGAGLSYPGLLDVLIDARLAPAVPRSAGDRHGPDWKATPSSSYPVVVPRTGISIYSCAPDEALLFKDFAPRLGVVTTMTEEPVSEANASMAIGNRCVSVGHKSKVSNATLLALSRAGVEYVSTRSVGYDHIDIAYARSVGITVGNTFYSPDSVADHAVMSMLMLLRNAKTTIHRTDVHDYRLHEVRGRELRDMTVGVVGTGRIGMAVIDRLRGFGCRILSCDSRAAASTAQVPIDVLMQQSDIVTLHAPLNASTHHLLDRRRIEQAKRGAFVINTGRGPLIDTEALVSALENGRLGGAALDVIEGEEGIFYADCRDRTIENKALLRLQEMPNVLISPHTAYYTDHALSDTVENSIINCLRFESENRRG